MRKLIDDIFFETVNKDGSILLKPTKGNLISSEDGCFVYTRKGLEFWSKEARDDYAFMSECDYRYYSKEDFKEVEVNLSTTKKEVWTDEQVFHGANDPDIDDDLWLYAVRCDNCGDYWEYHHTYEDPQSHKCLCEKCFEELKRNKYTEKELQEIEEAFRRG